MKRKDILCVGSIHLDIIGTPTGANSGDDIVDYRGDIDFSVGGSAYNIASNIVRIYSERWWFERPKVVLFSLLKKSSLISEVILAIVRRSKIRTNHVARFDFLPGDESASSAYGVPLTDSGFSAQMDPESRAVSTAVSSVALEHLNLDDSRLKLGFPLFRRSIWKALEARVGRSDIVVLDCNLSGTDISKVVACAFAHKKFVVIRTVSDSKADHLSDLDLAGHNGSSVVVSSDKEYERLKLLCTKNSEQLATCEPHDVCKKLGITGLAIHSQKHGVQLFLADGSVDSMSIGSPIGKGSWTGVGDSVAAAIADLIISGNWKQNDPATWRFDDGKVKEKVTDYVKPILREKRPTIANGLTWKPRPIWRRETLNRVVNTGGTVSFLMREFSSLVRWSVLLLLVGIVAVVFGFPAADLPLVGPVFEFACDKTSLFGTEYCENTSGNVLNAT